MSDFLVKLAENRGDIESAQRLRYEVFNLELKCGKTSDSKGLDVDSFDEICDHVLIIDKKSGRTIGTYRLLLRSKLGSKGSFYSEGEFDLGNIRSIKGEILEMGRSCVHKDFRSSSILLLLWQRILSYVEDHHVNYIIGVPSVYSKESMEINPVYSLMKKSYYSNDRFRVYPLKECRVPGLDGSFSLDGQEKKVFLKLPSLIRSYIKIGALVCGEPALDHVFGTADFFMLLEVEKMADSYLRRFRVHNVPLR
ncbi:MAG TPA: GNAT family N-acyltransferase [Candidatus Omnitrophota bacterium]|nr:GNAT family N-acyltransferase [Candidatus Omnitrophota bacterium]